MKPFQPIVDEFISLGWKKVLLYFAIAYNLLVILILCTRDLGLT